MQTQQTRPIPPTPKRPRRCLSSRNREVRGDCADRSIDSLQWGGFALLDRSGLGSGVRLVIQELARQTLVADDRVRVGRLSTASPNVGQSVLGATQAKIRSLFARLPGSRLFDDLAGLLAGTLFLRPCGARLRRAQIEVGR